MIHVLVVDDDSMVFSVMKKTIEWGRFDMEIVACATNGIKAIEYIKENPVDVVFTDIMMPHMGGIELIQHIHEFMPNIVFVVLSSYSEYALVKDSFKQGAFDYILKVDIDDKQTTSDILKRVKAQVENLRSTDKQKFYREKLLNKIDKSEIELNQLNYAVVAISLKLMSKAVSVSEFLFFLSKSNKNFVYSFFDWRIVILFYSEHEEGIKNSLDAIVKKINSINEIVDNVGISKIRKGIQIEILYDECIKAIKLKFYHTKQKTFFYSNPQSVDRDRLLKFREQVEDCAKNNKYDKLQITVEELFNFCKTLGVDKGELCDEVLLCIDAMQRSIPQVIIEIYGKKEKEIEEKVFGCDNFDQLRTVTKDIVDSYITFIYTQTGTGVTYIIKKYLENNYSNHELSLDMVAQALCMNKRELSKHLLDDSGRLFKQVINDIRIANAKEMILQSSLRINEISNKVGYTNVEHFTRIFTKEMGISPSQYLHKFKHS